MSNIFHLFNDFSVEQFKYWVVVVLLLGIVLPLGLDTDLVIPIKHYSLRANYLAHGLLFLFFSFSNYFEKNSLSYFSFFISNPELWCFLALGMSGLISLTFSENPSRSIYFWVWSIGTILSMKYLVSCLKESLGLLPIRVICSYWLIYSVIVIWDFFVCWGGWCDLKIGRVFNDWRPHGWYYEPSYFAGMGLFMVLCFFLWKKIEPNRTFNLLATGGLGSSLIATLCSTSRLGIVGLFLLALIGFALFFKTGLRQSPFKPWKVAVFFCGFLTLATVSPLKNSLLPILKTGDDGSKSERLASAKASWEVFLLSPWFGVGPGAAGSFFTNHLKDHPYNSFLKFKFAPSTLAAMKSLGRDSGGSAEQEPLGHSVWLELLSEWGIVGFFLYLMGVLIMLLKIGNRWFTAAVFSVLFVNHLLSQTLPRYDLWFALSLLVVFSPNLFSQHRTEGGVNTEL